MGFLSPWFLAGVIGVGLPVWLHLLKRHKTDPKPFPSLMFFERREQSSVVHRRLDHILLFILRTALLVLLALLFAAPYINRARPKASGQKLVVVAVDRSFSMRATEGGESRLEKAKRQAMDILNGLPATTAAQVVALSGQVEAMTQQTNDPAALRAAVVSIQPSDGRASFGELARFSRTLAESSKMPLEVHLVSDLQKSALPPGFTDLRLAGDTTLVLHSVGGEIPNWTVENVVAPTHVYDPKKVHIVATVAGFAAPAAKKTVSLVLNGKPVQSKPVDVPANGRATVEFLELPVSYGFNKCEVKIDSADALPGDDSFAFSVERLDPKKILFIDNGRGDKAELYLHTALVDASPDAAFQIEKMRPEAAANASLNGYALVILNDPGSMPGGLEANLQTFVNGGKGLMVVLGTQAAALPTVPIEGDTIDTTKYAGREAERFLTISSFEGGHPVLKTVGRMEGVRFYQVTHVTATKGHALATLNDQTPLIIERQIGEGKVLVFSSPLDNSVNDFPVHGAYFVPFVQQSAAYLGGTSAEQPVNVAVDQYVELRTGESKNTAAEVTDPDGKRLLSAQEATSARTYPLSREGFYEVTTATGKRSLVAAHADRRESDLAVIPKETLDLWTGTGSGGNAPNGTAASVGGDSTTPWSLSPFLLLLLLGVALAESVVANGYLRPPNDRPAARKEAA
ncbi:MAG TPA: BatA and WFA domain-containing protein [Bryobacteraceae bacterium]